MIALVTGSAGLVGSAVVRMLCARGYGVVGVDNDTRRVLFGEQASVRATSEHLLKTLLRYDQYSFSDLRRYLDCADVIETASPTVIVHCAAQPSHDWSAEHPLEDFAYNAQATLNLLEAARQHAPEAVFIHVSTNKVYGDLVNGSEYPEIAFYSRYEPTTGWTVRAGIPECWDIDCSMHSPFGCSKLAADVYAQEYGRYYGLKTVIFRCGCITGSAHQGVELHGFLSYLMKCCATGTPYTIYGYQGKQVRDNIHAEDLAAAFYEAIQKPPEPGTVFNMGGGRGTDCSVLEAIQMAEEITGRKMQYTISEQARKGDHKWWITDTSKFRAAYPNWKQQYTSARQILQEIYDANRERWAA